MFKLFKIMALMALIATSACSKKDESGLEKLVVISDGEKYEFQVEVADTKETLYKGLMGRTGMADNSGLLMDVTIVPKDMEVAMWMKDTLIPLDMIFLDENGTVFHIHENAKPNDTTPIYPPKRPRAVLEINAGQVAEYGIENGDVVQNRLLGNL